MITTVDTAFLTQSIRTIIETSEVGDVLIIVPRIWSLLDYMTAEIQRDAKEHQITLVIGEAS